MDNRQTMRTGKHEKAWSDFADWCSARGLRALPAHPWTVAAYARWCEVRHRFPVILCRIRVIARVHLLECVPSPDRHPTVMRTLRTLEVRSHSRDTRAALFPGDDAPAASTTANRGADSRAMAACATGAADKPVQRTTRGGTTQGQGRRRERTLRATPRLVSRRPK